MVNRTIDLINQDCDGLSGVLQDVMGSEGSDGRVGSVSSGTTAARGVHVPGDCAPTTRKHIGVSTRKTGGLQGGPKVFWRK